MERMKQLKDAGAECQELLVALKPWRGMTWKEARTKGWSEKQEQIQIRLWELSYCLARKRIGIIKECINELEEAIK